MEDIQHKVAALSCFNDPQDVTALAGGLTNVNILVRDGGRKYVVRFGDDIPQHGVMRWNELALSKAASSAGFSPAVIYSEPGVLVLDFIEAKTLTEVDVRDSATLTRIVVLIAKMHREIGAHLMQPALAFWPYHVNRSYIAQLISDGSIHQKSLPAMLAQNNQLEAATGPIEMVIGHNDLLAANILDDGKRLWLIDWEYGGFTSPLFDLAGLASNNGLSETQERMMLAQYFDQDADAQWRGYCAFKCSSLMRETLWSMTSEIHSDIDADYRAYTAENMDKLTSALAEFFQI
jgi:thiamine kinase-like enzyme